MGRTIGTILLTIMSTVIFAQTASVVMQSEIPVQITINRIQQHQHYSKSVKVNQLTGERPYNVQINFKDDTVFIKRNIYLIDNGLTHIYNVTKKNISLKKIVPDASYESAKEQLVVNYIENELMPLDSITKDSNQVKDTVYTPPFASYYKLKDYNGRLGCPFPLKDVEIAELRGIIFSESLEEIKLEKVKLNIQDMDSACVLVEQTKELIVLFEYEETRLDFAKFMYAYTFDLDNYGKLNEAFNFENSKDELKAFISTK